MASTLPRRARGRRSPPKKGEPRSPRVRSLLRWTALSAVLAAGAFAAAYGLAKLPWSTPPDTGSSHIGFRCVFATQDARKAPGE